MTKAQTAIVAVYVALGLLNLGLGLIPPFVSFNIINLLVGAYSMFRAKQEYEKSK